MRIQLIVSIAIVTTAVFLIGTAGAAKPRARFSTHRWR
jgi:hypothetical protein